MTPPLIVLRPEPGARRTIDAAGALGLAAMAVPLFAIERLHWFPPEPSRFEAIMFTSANAVRMGGGDLARFAALPVYAVGAATAEAARHAGFSHVREGPGDAAGLAALLARDGVFRALHFCGAHRRESAAPGLMIERVPVYESRAIDRPAGLPDALATGPLALIHSPRAGARFAELVDRLGCPRLSIALAAISAAALAAAGEGWAAAKVAERPDDTALLALAAGLCKTSDGLLGGVE